MLSASDLERYSRHLRLPQVGLAGQERLKASRVLVVGAGGLGSPVATYLAAAGVGTVGLIDPDSVALSNLQRQILYATGDVGRPKVWAARTRLLALNPDITIVAHEAALDADNVLDLLDRYDLVVDGSDNFATRYLLNDAAWMTGRPVVHAGMHRFHGQLAVFVPETTPCYRCLYPAPPAHAPSCSDGGVLGALAGIMGTLQASAALQVLLGIGEPPVGRLLLWDALAFSSMTVALAADPACPTCSVPREDRRLRPESYHCDAPAGPGDPEDWAVSAADLATFTPADWLDVSDTGLGSHLGLAGLRHVPLATLPDCLRDFPADRPLLAFCASGTAAREAVRLLRAAGMADTWYYDGPLPALQRAFGATGSPQTTDPMGLGQG